MGQVLHLRDAKDTKHKPGKTSLQSLELLCSWYQTQGMHSCTHLFIASLNNYNIIGNLLGPQATQKLRKP